MSGQSTDAANSAPLITATVRDSGRKDVQSRSAQDIAQDNPCAADKGGTQDAITAPIPGNA